MEGSIPRGLEERQRFLGILGLRSPQAGLELRVYGAGRDASMGLLVAEGT